MRCLSQNGSTHSVLLLLITKYVETLKAIDFVWVNRFVSAVEQVY